LTCEQTRGHTRDNPSGAFGFVLNFTLQNLISMSVTGGVGDQFRMDEELPLMKRTLPPS